jgi:hypothetical protein
MAYQDRDAEMGDNHKFVALRGVAPQTRVKILAKIADLDSKGVMLSPTVPIESYLPGFDVEEVNLFKAAYEQVLEERLLTLRENESIQI